MTEDFAVAFSGLGLFFAGLHLLTIALRKASGRRVREALARWTQGAPRAVGWGVVLGAMTQSMTAVLFMQIGLVRTGAIAMETVYPLLAGAALGSSVLAVLAAFKIDLLMLVMLGGSGFLISRNKASLAQVANILFAAGLLFLGLHQIKAGATPLLRMDMVRGLLSQSQGSVAAAVALGTLFRLVVHSSVAIVILAATLAATHVLTLTQAIALVGGVSLGSAASIWMLSSEHRGLGRQVAACGMAANIAGALGTLVMLLLPSPVEETSLGAWLLTQATDNIEMQVGLALALAGLPGLLLVPLRRRIVAFLAHRWPPTQEEGDSVSRYLRDDALADPESCIDLVVMEQRDMTRFLSRMLVHARNRSDSEALYAAFDLRLQQIRDFMEGLAGVALSTDAYGQLAALINSQRHLEALGTTIHDLVLAIRSGGARLDSVTGLIIESVDTVLLTFESYLLEGDEYDLLLLRAMTGNRSNALQRIRESFLEREAELDNQSRLNLLTLTNLCERFFWLMGTFLDTPVSPQVKKAAS